MARTPSKVVSESFPALGDFVTASDDRLSQEKKTLTIQQLQFEEQF
jgi:hypothetical protein